VTELYHYIREFWVSDWILPRDKIGGRKTYSFNIIGL